MYRLQKNNSNFFDKLNNPINRIITYTQGGTLIGAAIGYGVNKEKGASIGAPVGAIIALIGGSIAELIISLTR